ncbi:MAG TPA: hypothetical protein VFD01_13090 [Candidatus Dormibacteraeota bacterium]|jgi:hypothetical protein|nr:hypothetical protein [Candidatus Dormibacteraeota bacterium]
MDHGFTGRGPVRPTAGGESVELSAPLAAASGGSFELRGAAARVSIRADAALSLRYRARIEGARPEAETGGDTTVIRLRWPLRDPVGEWRRRTVEVVLNASFPWEVRVRGGASELRLDFAAGGLRSFELLGGVARAELVLPPPQGDVVLRLLGGAGSVRVRRPAGIPVRLRIDGVGRVECDGQRLGVAAGSLHFEPPSFAAAPARYDLRVIGGLGELSVDRSSPA